MISTLDDDSRAEVLTLLDRVFRRSQPFFGPRFPLLFSPENAGHVYVYREAAHLPLVATISVYVSDLVTPQGRWKAAALGAVATSPEHRGRGYASALLAHCEGQLRQEGVDLVYVSGEGRLYREWGANPLGRLREVVLDRSTAVSAPPLPPTLLQECRHVGPAEAALIYRLYALRPSRFERTVEETLAYLQGNLFSPPGEENTLWVVGEAQNPHGYLVARTANEGTTRLLRVVEHGGVTTVLPSLVAELFQRRAIDKVLYYLSPDEFSAPGHAGIEVPLTGTIKILNPSLIPLLPRLQLPAINELHFV